MQRRSSARQRGQSPNRDPIIRPWSVDDPSNETLQTAFANLVLLPLLPFPIAEEEQLPPVEELEDEAFEVEIMAAAEAEGADPIPCLKDLCTYKCTVGTREQRHASRDLHMLHNHELKNVTKRQFARDEACKGPTITGELAPTKWRSFLMNWEEHKEAIGLCENTVTSRQVTNRLKQCLDQNIRDQLQVR